MYGLLVINFAVIIGNIFACMQDCSDMAGTECTVYEDCTNESVRGRNAEDYPGLPRDVTVIPIPRGSGVPGHNITWFPASGEVTPEGFGVISRKMNDPDDEVCTHYVIHGDVLPDAQFYYNCSDETSYYHEIFTLPRQNADVDYIHRIVNVYPQNHDQDNTVNWSPYVAEIDNNSCASAVTLKFDAPPAEYGFTEFLVDLISVNGDETQSQTVVINSSTNQLIFKFVNLSSGHDYFLILKSPNEIPTPGASECTCKYNGACNTCSTSSTSEFLIDTSHPKCYVPPTEKPINGNDGGISASVIGISATVTVVALSIIVIIVFVIRKRKPKPVDDEEPYYSNALGINPDDWHTAMQNIHGGDSVSTVRREALSSHNTVQQRGAGVNTPSDSYHTASVFNASQVSNRLADGGHFPAIAESDESSHVNTVARSTIIDVPTYDNLTTASDVLNRGNGNVLLSDRNNIQNPYSRADVNHANALVQSGFSQGGHGDNQPEQNATRIEDNAQASEFRPRSQTGVSAISEISADSDVPSSTEPTIPMGRLRNYGPNAAFNATNNGRDVNPLENNSLSVTVLSRVSESSANSDNSYVPDGLQPNIPIGRPRSDTADSSISV